jgi:uncharacterized membrane protein
MLARDFRKKAMDALKGKWGRFALIYLIYTLITTVCSYALSAASLIIAGPFAVGIAMIALKVLSNEEFEIINLFDGFKKFTNTLLLGLLNTIYTFLWSLLFVIPGIVKGLSYSMSYFIIAENPNMTQNEARLESMRIMQGNKWRLFCLQFSFIGWYILSSFTAGILLFWVVPYVQTATAAFYEEIKNKPIAAEATPEI